MNQTKIGKKIKDRRIELNMTQQDLSGGVLTRNMLSLIENGKAYPSYENACYLAKALNLPLEFLYSDDDSVFYFEKKNKIDYIKSLFSTGAYSRCIDVIQTLGGTDDEIDYLLANCGFSYGKALVLRGAMLTAIKQFEIAESAAERTIYPVKDILAAIPMYRAIAANIQAPLLEFDSDRFLQECKDSSELEFYAYLSSDINFPFSDETYKKHMWAKSLMRKYNYIAALATLGEIESVKKSENYNAYVLFSVYTDMENCYKSIGDFENAYRYSSKRLVLLNNFNT